MMWGTREPKLNPLDPMLRAWADKVMSDVSPGKLRADVEEIPSPRNRLHSPEAMARSDEIIMQNFRDSGWATEYRPYEFQYLLGFLDYDDGEFPAGTKLTIYPRLSGANILGIKPGLHSTDAILVGAHQDTIRDSPGADDNTASIVAVMELARVLAPYSFHDTIILAAFDMEEINFVGSRTLVPQLCKERSIKGAIIYETMAYTNDTHDSQVVPPGMAVLYPGQTARMKRRNLAGDWTIVVYRGSSQSIAQSFGEGLAHTAGPDAPVLMRDPLDLPILGRAIRRLVPAAHSFSRSDHAAFWEAGIPAVMIGDTAEFRNPHYHKPTDTPDTLNYGRLAAIVGATAVAVARMAGLKSYLYDS